MFDEISCSVNWRSDYSCSYLIFSVLLISSPANLLTQMWTLMLIYKTVKRRYFTRADRRKSKESPQISVSLTSSLASSSIAALSRSFVLNESYEVLTVMLVSVTYTLTSLPKNLVDAAQACTASDPLVDPRLVFWTSVGREFGATFLIPLVLLLFHQRLRSSVRSLVRCSLTRLGLHRWLGDGGGGGHHQETIYLSTRPSTSIATTSNTAVTVI
ncbi:unnamed protein product [Medioppia subpectinata]|uniref:Uncharacterized protein n=1 Tax=Medioppia subpectinata TaxID=1979941 RepID=A0A7R9KWZ1_9ACAR|nr:unnamed protein product [Medioppia subpectinata]CAG2111057.1 unnamed protein product [Medioppia subpectinata]